MTSTALNPDTFINRSSLNKVNIGTEETKIIQRFILSISDKFIDLLSGRSVDYGPIIASKEQLLESFSSVDVAFRFLSNLYAFERVDIELMHGIFREANAPVFLADGTKLSRTEAERKLTQKEEKRAFAPLRHAMEGSSKRNWPAIEGALTRFQELQNSFCGPDTANTQEAIDSLQGVLANHHDLALECMGILMGPQAEGWESKEEFARLLDPIDEDGGFSDAAARALSLRMRDAAEKRICRPLTRIRAPDAMTGHVMTMVPGAVRVLHADARRAYKFSQMLSGGATGVIASLFPLHSLSANLDAALRIIGHAFALGAHLPLVRKSVLDESPHKARKNGQQAMALWYLLQRMDVVLALSSLQEKQSSDIDGLEILRENIFQAFGANCDPTWRFWQLKRLPPWPGSWGSLDILENRLNGLTQQAQAATLFFRLRERFDEVFPLMSAPFEQIADAGNALSEGLCSVADLYDFSEDADGSVDLISEFLAL
jgi:hypothetical protein